MTKLSIILTTICATWSLMYLARNWEAAIINIGHADTRGGFFTRVLHLIQDPGGERLAPYAAAPVLAPTARQKAAAV